MEEESELEIYENEIEFFVSRLSDRSGWNDTEGHTEKRWLLSDILIISIYRWF